MTHNRRSISRLVAIDSAIRSGKLPNAFQLAEQLECTHRTILRDLDYLRDELGAPLEFDRKRNGFRYTNPDWSMPLVRVTEGELVALLLAEQVLRQYAATPYADQLRTAFRKLTAALDSEVTFDASTLAAGFSVRPTAPLKASAIERFKELGRAIRERSTLEISYHSVDRKEPGVRLVDPYHLAFIEGAPYLLAWCHTRKAVRMFRPDRIKKLKETGGTFDAPAGFDPSEYLGSAFRTIRGDGEPQRVQLVFTPQVARWVQERTWHPTQSLRCRADGSLEMTLQLSDLREVVRWVLSFGPDCRAVEPKELVEAVAQSASDTASQYSLPKE